MKRKDNLYQEMCKIENIIPVFNEICRNTRNKRKVARYKESKCANIYRAYAILTSKSYTPSKPFVFTIYEPKERRIESQPMEDKLINHLVSRYILHPAILPCLIGANVASREGKGTNAGLMYFKKYSSICKRKYGTYYILKGDVKKFFYSIDKEILKKKVERKIKDKDALDIVFKIIDSEEHGLGIGNMTSQVLAIFYLNDLDHYIKEELKIKYYIRYQDDFLLFHPSKKYLQYCLTEIENFIKKEHLSLNAKTRIYKNTNNFLFLGRNSQGNYARYRNVKRKLKGRFYLYGKNLLSLNSYATSLICYKGLCNKNIILKKK